VNARQKFEVGDRVKVRPLNPGERFPSRRATRGVVTGHCREPQLVRVLMDGHKSVSTFHCDWFVPEDADADADPGFDPIHLGM
jgi:hypothetical protein